MSNFYLVSVLYCYLILLLNVIKFFFLAKKVQMREDVDKLRKERKQKLKKDQDKIDQFQEQQRRNEEARLKREETERAIHAKLNKGK